MSGAKQAMVAFNRIESRRRQYADQPLDFNLTPTQGAYVMSDAIVNGIYSATGEGKSFAGVIGILVHGQRNLAYSGIDEIECYILRDTHENLKKSPIPTFKEVLGPRIEFRNQEREAYIYTHPFIILKFFGVTDADLAKLQGPEVALIWPEEVCPIQDATRYNGGLSEDVFNAALVRCARQQGTIPRLQVSGNPGDQDHWFYRRLVEPPDGIMDPAAPLITKACFRIPYGENVFAKEISRQAVIAAYANDPESYKRFVTGEFVPLYKGKKVTPAFKKERHVAKEILVPFPGIPAFRLWDSWGEPRCVLGQQMPDGQMRLIDVIEDHTDIMSICPKVQTAMNAPKWKNIEIPSWRDIGDCTMKRRDQSRADHNAAKVVEDTFLTTFEPGSARWDTGLKVAIGTSFRMSTSTGEPCILINPELKKLIAAFDGRWHYATDASGNVKNPKDGGVKDAYSHAADAVANGCSVLQPWAPLVHNVANLQQMRAKQRKRAAGYGLPKVSYG